MPTTITVLLMIVICLKHSENILDCGDSTTVLSLCLQLKSFLLTIKKFSVDVTVKLKLINQNQNKSEKMHVSLF